jgi:hypothetical protein
MKSSLVDIKTCKSGLHLLGRAVINSKSRATFPLILNNAPAGFPSPADDYIEGTLGI